MNSSGNFSPPDTTANSTGGRLQPMAVNHIDVDEFDDTGSGGLGQSKGLIIGSGIAVVVLLIVGYFISISAQNAKTETTQAVATFQSRQMEMMEQAMDMARQAQQAQREHMRMMEEAMRGEMEGAGDFDVITAQE